MGDAAIGQRQVGEKMMRADDAADRQVRHGRVDMRHEMEAARSGPRSLDGDVGEVDGDELADRDAPVGAGNDLEIDLRLRQRRGPSTAVNARRRPLISSRSVMEKWRCPTSR
jgi:hypothetical protein